MRINRNNKRLNFNNEKYDKKIYQILKLLIDIIRLFKMILILNKKDII